MDRYIQQLVSDINTIISQLPEPPSNLWDSVDITNDCEMEDISYIESYLNGNQYILSDILQIKSETFPPEEKLNDAQVSTLNDALSALLEYHHYEAAYPDELTDRAKYKLIIKTLNTQQPRVTYGIIGLEFCHYNEDNCPIPGECNQCKKFKLEEEQEPRVEKDYYGDVTNPLPTAEEIEKFVNHRNNEEIRDVIKNFVPSEKNIEGIFNYCDRWCERCNFTLRCTNFEMEKQMGIHDNVSIEDTLKYMKIIFEETGKMLASKMQEFGIDMNAIPEVDELPKKGRKSPLELLSIQYMKDITQWLDTNDDKISSYTSHLWNVNQKKYKEFDAVISTISYYTTIIPVKMTRAVKPRHKYEDDEFNETDKLATGKLLLVCIEKSMNALLRLMEILPAKADEFIDFLSKLSQMKNGVEKALPAAKSYIRKGLDE